jgi:hypothetical protein
MRSDFMSISSESFCRSYVFLQSLTIGIDCAFHVILLEEAKEAPDSGSRTVLMPLVSAVYLFETLYT